MSSLLRKLREFFFDVPISSTSINQEKEEMKEERWREREKE